MAEHNEIGSSARSEAVAFFRFFKKGEPAEELRATIRPGLTSDPCMTKHRLAVLGWFDTFVDAGKVPGRVKKTGPPQKRKTRKRNNGHGGGGRRRVLTPEQIQEANKALLHGAKWGDLVRIYDVSKMTLQRHVKLRRNFRRTEAAPPRKEKAARGSGWRMEYGRFGQGT
jgi:hypothetical protein